MMQQHGHVFDKRAVRVEQAGIRVRDQVMCKRARRSRRGYDVCGNPRTLVCVCACTRESPQIALFPAHDPIISRSVVPPFSQRGLGAFA